jgi:hypothetical protein
MSVIIFNKKKLFVSYLEISEHINAPRRRNSATTSTQLALTSLNHTWCKLKHAQTCLYYDQVAWLPLRSAVKQFRGLYSHTVYLL